jgi:hypothetical protein
LSQERWDVALKVLGGPLAGMGEQVYRGPVVRLGANPGSGGLKLNGYRGLDGRHCVITAYEQGNATVAPVGTSQVRLAPHPNVKWKDIDPLGGPEYLSKGCAVHLGPVGRGATVEFVECRRLGVWEGGRIASDVDASQSAISTRGGPPVAIDARSVGTVNASSVPMWFIGALFTMVMGTVILILGSVLGILWLQRDVTDLGPVVAGEELYTPDEIGKVELNTELYKGLAEPFNYFIMEPNRQAASNLEGLEREANWDKVFQEWTTKTMQTYLQSWSFFKRLESIKGQYSQVVLELRANELPDVFAGIPYQESRYKSEITSAACARGYWQFMPEVAFRVGRRSGRPFVVKDCTLTGKGSYRFTPTMEAPPQKYRTAEYILVKADDSTECLITGCAVDDRTDLVKSTRAAVYALKEAFLDPTLRQSGSVTQLTILSHNVGYDDARFGVRKIFNVLPAYKKRMKGKNPAEGAHFYGDNLLCQDLHSKRWCGSGFPPEGQHYVHQIVGQHFLAVCYYAKNYGNDPAYSAWKRFVGDEGYCTEMKIPTAQEVRNYRKR